MGRVFQTTLCIFTNLVRRPCSIWKTFINDNTFCRILLKISFILGSIVLYFISTPLVHPVRFLVIDLDVLLFKSNIGRKRFDVNRSPKGVREFFSLNSNGCRWIAYDALKTSTIDTSFGMDEEGGDNFFFSKISWKQIKSILRSNFSRLPGHDNNCRRLDYPE